MRTNKKGFTVIELIAVTVILIVIFLIALNAVRESNKKAHMNSIKASATSYLRTLNNVLGENIVEDDSFDDGVYTISEIDAKGIQQSGNTPTGGYVFVVDNFVSKYCLEFENTYYLLGTTEQDISNPVTGKCEIANAGTTYAYTGTEEIFTADKDGAYLIEVWGAQGGNYSREYQGGYGGYARGFINLEIGDKLYINVGGRGNDKIETVEGVNAGGYNGGGDAYSVTSRCNNYAGAGGGATSIATTSGLIKDITIDDLVLVAGGGGGAEYIFCNVNDTSISTGGSGGGLNGHIPANYTTVYTVTMGTGGSQTEGGLFVKVNNESGNVSGSYGQGGQTARTGGATNFAGGGGGLYGGGTGGFMGATGGSGYINKSLLTRYSFSSYSTDNTSSEYTTCVDRDPVSKCAKQGHGSARIVYIGSISD